MNNRSPDIDYEVLITLVRSHRILYEKVIHSYQNRPMRQNAWRQIAKEMNKDMELCQTRWRGLRDRFARECGKIVRNEIEKSHWPYFKQLLFLKDYIKPKKFDRRNITDPLFEMKYSADKSPGYLFYGEETTFYNDNTMDVPEIVGDDYKEQIAQDDDNDVDDIEEIEDSQSPSPSHSPAPEVPVKASVPPLPRYEPAPSSVVDRPQPKKSRQSANEKLLTLIERMQTLVDGSQQQQQPVISVATDDEGFYAHFKKKLEELPEEEKEETKIFLLNYLYDRIKSVREHRQ